MKQAVIYLEKEIVNGKECYIVKGWDSIKRLTDLPTEYLEGYPHFYWVKSSVNDFITLVPFSNSHCYIHRGNHYIRKIWDKEFVPVFGKAGKRLSEILKKDRWNGRVEVKI